MSPHESRSFWCFLEGSPKPYNVFDIPLSANIFQLKGLIQQAIKRLRSTDACDLKLLKLNVRVPIDPDDSLAQRLGEQGNIAMSSRELSSGENVGVLFCEPYSQDHLHIVIQHPDILPPSLNVSQKRLRPATDEDGRAAKRKAISGDEPDIQICCAAIHNVITTMPDKNLSDPSMFMNLPYPSPLQVPYQRFVFEIIDKVTHFEYMGRSQFLELQQRIKKQHFLEGCGALYLYGTSGSGKSHLLAALVYHLVREGNRVFYIPNCYDYLLDPSQTIWEAFHFAYYGCPDLGTIDNTEAMIDFLVKDRDVYVIVDQVNALDYTENDRRKDKKIQAVNWVDKLRYRHRFIFSASANEESNREAHRKQLGISVIPTFGGMNQDETDQWFIQHHNQIPQLSPEQRQRVEYLTGCIPLLLRCLIGLTNFDELKFRNISDLANVISEVDNFARTKVASLAPLNKEAYLKIMTACVRGDRVSIHDRSLMDLRHFYIDAKEIGRFTCGIAFEAMMSALRKYDNAPFLDGLWYEAVERSNNPIVRGFLAEQICLSHIAAHGLRAVHSDLGPMSSMIFEDKPAFDEFLSTGQATRLYVPIAYNFATVDGAILMLNHATKKATIFAIQFTLSQRHKQSDEEFHKSLWPTWIKSMVTAGFRVDSTFVWIDTMQPSEHVKPRVVKALRSGDKVVHPEYAVIHVGVGMVDKKLATAFNVP